VNVALTPFTGPDGTSPSMKAGDVLHGPEVPSTCTQLAPSPDTDSSSPFELIATARELVNTGDLTGREAISAIRPMTSLICTSVLTWPGNTSSPVASSARTSLSRRTVELGGTCQISSNCTRPSLL